MSRRGQKSRWCPVFRAGTENLSRRGQKSRWCPRFGAGTEKLSKRGQKSRWCPCFGAGDDEAALIPLSRDPCMKGITTWSLSPGRRLVFSSRPRSSRSRFRCSSGSRRKTRCSRIQYTGTAQSALVNTYACGQPLSWFSSHLENLTSVSGLECILIAVVGGVKQPDFFSLTETSFSRVTMLSSGHTSLCLYLVRYSAAPTASYVSPCNIPSLRGSELCRTISHSSKDFA